MRKVITFFVIWSCAILVSGVADAGKPAGLPLLGSLDDRENVQRQVDEGARLLLVGGDEPCLVDALRRVLQPLAHLRE